MQCPPRLPRHEVFVGRLAYSVTEDELRDMFSECGPVVRVSITAAEKFENPKLSDYTYGFVGFSDKSSVKKAVSWFNCKKLHGREILVEETHRSKESTGPPSPVIMRKEAVPSNNSVKERMMYIQKCYDEAVQAKPDLQLPAWSDFRQTIERQSCSVSTVPFTFPVESLHVDLTEIDELVRKTSSSSLDVHRET